MNIETLVLRGAVGEGDLAWESELAGRQHTLSRTLQIDSEDPARPCSTPRSPATPTAATALTAHIEHTSKVLLDETVAYTAPASA